MTLSGIHLLASMDKSPCLRGVHWQVTKVSMQLRLAVGYRTGGHKVLGLERLLEWQAQRIPNVSR